MALQDHQFVDMYLGPDYCVLRGVEGTAGGIVPAPKNLQPELDALRTACEARARHLGMSEFALPFQGVKYRVTAITDVTDNNVWILSLSGFDVRPLTTIGLTPAVQAYVTNKALKGLFIVCGPMRAGKTNTVASIFKARAEMHGGIGLTVEDPPEADLHGQHGAGRIIQVPVARQKGGFHEQLMRALRSRADQFLVGEVRDPTSTLEMLRMATAVGPIFVTTHGESPEQTLATLQARCRGIDMSADALNAMLADAISGILWQRLETTATATGHAYRLVTKTLIVHGPQEHIIKTKIRQGRFSELQQEISQQSQLQMWTPPKP